MWYHTKVVCYYYRLKFMVKNPFKDFFWQENLKNGWVKMEKWSWNYFLNSSNFLFLKKNVRIWPERKVPLQHCGPGWSSGWKSHFFQIHQWPKRHYLYVLKKNILKLWGCNFHQILSKYNILNIMVFVLDICMYV